MINQKRSIILVLWISVLVCITLLSIACPAGPQVFHTVSFESNGGSVVDDITDVAHGTRIVAPADPTFEGRVFAGWFKDQGFNAAWNFAVDRVVQDLTLYAKWTAETTYTVSFDSNEGSAVDDITGIASGATIDEPADPTKAGFTFDGWYKEDGLINAWNFIVDPVTENLTLYAKWTAETTYIVTFDCNGGSAVDDITGVLPNAKITEPDEPTWTYRLFGGWYTDPSLSSWFEWDFAVDEVTDDITLYAKWTFGGEGPAGGLVFYENANYVADGWRYLEAAPKSEERDSLRWAPSGMGGIVVGASAEAIGAGQANTTAIVNALGVGSYAAQYCNDLVYGTKGDWFLPSILEAKAMRNNLYRAYAGGFTNDWYWSSTEWPDYDALSFEFDAGTYTQTNKASFAYNIYVRPIRAFQEIE